MTDTFKYIDPFKLNHINESKLYILTLIFYTNITNTASVCDDTIGYSITMYEYSQMFMFIA